MSDSPFYTLVLAVRAFDCAAATSDDQAEVDEARATVEARARDLVVAQGEADRLLASDERRKARR